MAWIPDNQVPDTRPLIENLLDFIRDNQVEAFRWANGGTTPLKSFAVVYNNASGRVVDEFPSLLVAQDRFTTPYDVGVLASDWTVILETAIEGADTTALVIESRKYQYAIESMVRNITSAELLAGANLMVAVLESTDTEFDVIGKGIESKYVQVFYTSARFTIHSQARN